MRVALSLHSIAKLGVCATDSTKRRRIELNCNGFLTKVDRLLPCAACKRNT